MNRDGNIAEADGKKSAKNLESAQPAIAQVPFLLTPAFGQPWLQLSTGAFPN